MRSVIGQLLAGDSDLQLIGEAASFAETLELTAVLKPDILVLDLHLSDEREYPVHVVKTQILQSVDCVVAISLWNDAETNALAKSLGARALLDKANLYSTLIPAIKLFCPNGDKRAGAFVRGNGQPVAANLHPESRNRC
jgi:DNA-binding NarL/FixJ family response regulator